MWEGEDGVEDTGRRGSKGGDGPKMKMCLKYCGWGGGDRVYKGLQVSCVNIKQKPKQNYITIYRPRSFKTTNQQTS